MPGNSWRVTEDCLDVCEATNGAHTYIYCTVADHCPPSSAEVKNDGAVFPLSHTSSWRSV
jgi:hypothetical protein